MQGKRKSVPKGLQMTLRVKVPARWSPDCASEASERRHGRPWAGQAEAETQLAQVAYAQTVSCSSSCPAVICTAHHGFGCWLAVAISCRYDGSDVGWWMPATIMAELKLCNVAIAFWCVYLVALRVQLGPYHCLGSIPLGGSPRVAEWRYSTAVNWAVQVASITCSELACNESAHA